jgi:hypothetical protein
MDALLEHQAATEAESVRPHPHADIDPEATQGLDEQDRFFRELGDHTPQPPSSAPKALGSADLRSTAARPANASSRARTRGKRLSPARPETSHEVGRRTVSRISAIALGGVAVMLIAGLAIANLGSSPSQHAKLASTSPSTTHLNAVDTLAATLETFTAAHHLAGPHHSSTRQLGHRKPLRRGPRRHLHAIPAYPAASTSVPTTNYQSTGASSGTSSSSNRSTPASRADTGTSGSSSRSTPPAEHSTSASASNQPAFGANGTLGPGSSPNG